MNCELLLSLSMITRITFILQEWGGQVTESSETSFQTTLGSGEGCKRPCDFELEGFIARQTSHTWIKDLMSLVIPFQKNDLEIREMEACWLECPLISDVWPSKMTRAGRLGSSGTKIRSSCRMKYPRIEYLGLDAVEVNSACQRLQ